MHRFVGSLLIVTMPVLLTSCGRAGLENQPVLADPMPDEPKDNGGLQPAPIVLMHGMAGFESIGPVEYFYEVADAIRDDGYVVYATVVDPIQSIEIRAAQAAEQIDAILAETGASVVHLVGHSQGGLDARHVIAGLGYGDRVATVTTIASPHRGTKLADIAIGTIPGDFQAATAAIVNALVGATTGTDADLQAQITEISSEHMTTVFNPANPDDPRVRYFSITGKTQPWWLVDITTVDIVDPTLLSAYWMTRSLQGDNDGLVPVSSAQWGEYWGEIPADHFDQMGWWPEFPQPAFDHKTWYRNLAAHLNGDGPIP